ncbi:MAG: 16S rRNA (guanine(527)-N(7))-methyltransferase RsmG [Gammaproteobacteria bacterium]|nr:16S rRNA (guanine(527)-N(7))-methyltransferase RsmG [Gammaproteobacteria bacterium]
MADESNVVSTSLELSLSDQQTAQLKKFCALLKQWNQTYNLVSAKDIDALWPRHILDSLSIGPELTGDRILDLGSGAGLPGLPLAITEAQRQFTLLDSVGKKTRFCQQVVMELGLNNVEVVNERAEHYQAELPFATVTARAVAPLAKLIDSCQHLLAPTGRIVAMKGRYPTAELDQMPADWVVHKVTRVDTDGGQAERHIVVMQKANQISE